MIERLKQLLGISADDDAKDILVQFALDDVESVILNYCNLSAVPDGLKTTWLRMALELYRNENLGSVEGSKYVSNISEGDSSVSFKTNYSDFKDSLLKNYIAQLNMYRRLRK
ncbi:phage head-tail connector protein [Cellulosilyticum sp. ST5]|uniref:phage head-tail connector protein n=1 Tax=Cellulosilyticum sp. ST5 TaxID=3055805 RepID=UPI003977D601